jgi:hypothetical protein
MDFVNTNLYQELKKEDVKGFEFDPIYKGDTFEFVRFPYYKRPWQA